MWRGRRLSAPPRLADRSSPLDVCLRSFRVASASGGRPLEQCALGAEFRNLRSSLLELLAHVVELLSQISLANQDERQLVSLLKGSVHRGWLWLPGAACAERTNPIGIAAPLATPTSDARDRHNAHCNATKRYVQHLVHMCRECRIASAARRSCGARVVGWSGADAACWRGWSSAADGVAMDQRGTSAPPRRHQKAVRIAAFHDLVEQIPATVLAELIDYNPVVVAKRAAALAAQWQTYAALRATPDLPVAQPDNEP